MTKPQEKTEDLLDWRLVNEELRQMGRRKLGMDRLQGDLAKEVEKLKKRYGKKFDLMIEEQKVSERVVREFTKLHPKDLKNKSRRLTFGRVGFRTPPSSIKFLWPVDKIIEALKKRKLGTCVQVKEKPVKDALRLLGDAILGKVGCKRTTGRETFFIDLALEKIRKNP